MRLLQSLLAVVLPALLATAPLARAADAAPVSYTRDIVPIFQKSCTGCHHPGKLKGKLDMTSFAALMKGGKSGAVVQAKQPGESLLIDMIVGDVPDMPEDGDPLSKAEIDLIAKWIAQGAADDTPARPAIPVDPIEYGAAPVTTTLAYSPDGSIIAVSGYHEVLLVSAESGELVGRLVGEAPRIEAVAFSADGARLAVAGGAPGRFGSIQLWDVAKREPIKSWRISHDSLYGVSFSPDGKLLAFGGADKTARVLNIETGAVTLESRAHSDWVFDTTFTIDGKRLVSGSRDMVMKLTDIDTNRFVDDINNPLEEVLSFDRHPKQDVIVFGGGSGTPFIYRISDNQGRTAARNDTNLVRKLERQPGPVFATAYSADGSLIAVGSTGGEVRIYKASDGSRVATCPGHEGAVFALAFSPDGSRLATGGYDGTVRVFEAGSGKLVKAFVAAPMNARPAGDR